MVKNKKKNVKNIIIPSVIPHPPQTHTQTPSYIFAYFTNLPPYFAHKTSPIAAQGLPPPVATLTRYDKRLIRAAGDKTPDHLDQTCCLLSSIFRLAMSQAKQQTTEPAAKIDGKFFLSYCVFSLIFAFSGVFLCFIIYFLAYLVKD